MAGEQNQSGDMRALIEQIAKALVDEPEKVSVQTVEGDTTVLELRVAQGDLGKVIGKQGRTARSMRTILGAAGMKLHRRFTLEIVE
jgi:predicted RNA-binding protein YlqC (UPF0109 family)